MALPVLIWALVQASLVQGDANSAHLTTGNWVSLALVLCALVISGFLLSRMILRSNSPKA
ncbi:MAG: hypothetical protein ACPGOY_05250 [Rhodospirillaceae bacterium]